MTDRYINPKARPHIVMKTNVGNAHNPGIAHVSKLHATARPKSGRLRSNLMAYKIYCFLLHVFAIKLLLGWNWEPVK